MKYLVINYKDGRTEIKAKDTFDKLLPLFRQLCIEFENKENLYLLIEDTNGKECFSYEFFDKKGNFVKELALIAGFAGKITTKENSPKKRFCQFKMSFYICNRLIINIIIFINRIKTLTP